MSSDEDSYGLLSQSTALSRMEKLVQGLLARPDAAPFAEPVDWKGLELFDYPDIVSQPMDLGTVLSKLKKHQYPNAATCAADIKLVWANCMSYNAEESDFWVLAKQFNRRFDDQYRKIRYECDVGEAPKPPPTANESDDDESTEEEELDMDDDDDAATDVETNDTNNTKPIAADPKIEFANYVNNLRGVHLGTILHKMQQSCPDCLVYDPALPGKVELVLDKLDTTTNHWKEWWDFAKSHAVPRPRTVPKIVDTPESKRRKHKLGLEQHHSSSHHNSDRRGRGRPRNDGRDILQIDIQTGETVNVFSSLSAAGSSVGFSRHIVNGLLRGKYKHDSYKGWTFRYADTSYDSDADYPNTNQGSGKKRKKHSGVVVSQRAVTVVEVDALTGKIRHVHPSLTQASKKSGANRHVITKVLNGDLESWEGIKWEYSKGAEPDKNKSSSGGGGGDDA